MGTEVIAAVDLGGTKCLVVLLDANLKVISEVKIKTPGTKDGKQIRNLIVEKIKDLLQGAGLGADALLAIGVAVPGAVDAKQGIVHDTPNIGFKAYPLRTELSRDFPCPIYVENDVNAGVYGEFRLGAARGLNNVVGIFPGTGIGGGLVIDGKLFRGSRGAAGEIGHMRIQDGGRLCGCGHRGCLEALASKTSLAKDLVALAATGKAPIIYEEAGTDFTKIRSGVIRRSVKAGETEVVALVNQMAIYLGIGMANCVNIFDPDAIILGGGLIEKMESEIVPVAESAMREHAQSFMAKDVKVIVASLGDHAVVSGLGAIASEALAEGRKR
jgi:glucokinase